MKYLRFFNEKIDINLKDVKIVEGTFPGIYDGKSICRTLSCIYEDKTVAKMEFVIFTDSVHWDELKDIFKNEIYIQHLYTRIDYQENGLANMLLKEVIQYAREIGTEVITLKYNTFTTKVNFIRRQYEKVGFKVFKENKMILPLVPGRW